MVARNNDWESCLKHHVYFPQTNIDKQVYLSGGEPFLRMEILEWLDENVGETNKSSWHKNPYYPKRPKWMFVSRRLSYVKFTMVPYECCIKFLEEEDAVAFALTWF